MASEQDQRALVEAAAKGDDASFELLMRFYQAKVRAYSQIYAYRINEQVDDLAQEIFLQIYLSVRDFKARSSVSTWIFSIAKYTINNKIRKKRLLYFWQFSKGDTPINDESIMSDIVTSEDGESHFEAEQNKRLLQNCLVSLRPQHREILLLFEFAELPYEAISKVLNIRVGTVKSRLFQARKELAKRVKKAYE